MLRLTCVFAFSAFVVGMTAVESIGHAQSMSTSTGTCTGAGLGTGTTFAGTVGLAVRDSDGTFTTVSAEQIPSAFSHADCVCKSTDLNLQIQVTMPLPISPMLTVEVWVGTACDMAINRTSTTQTQCERLVTGVPQYLQFTSASSASSPYIYVPIPADRLFAPNKDTCEVTTASNQIYVLIFSDPNKPAICSLTGLQQVSTSPDQVNPSTAPGDGRVTLTWPDPKLGNAPKFFQVLCATADGQPVAGKGGTLAYSVCTPDGIRRRKLTPGSSVGTGVDGGTTTTADLGTTSEPLEPLAVEPSQAAFEALNPMYLCSDQLPSNARNFTVAGLNNNQNYQFILVGIDVYGNPTASQVVVGTPQPAEDLFQRYVNSGGKATGFCFVATAAFGSYDSGWVQVLRDFRDEWLLTTPEGRLFVDWYYAHGPEAAQFLVEHPAARVAVRFALIPVIAVAAIFVYTSATQKALALALLALVLIGRSRRRAARGVA
jgi:hypothetical protein